MIIDSRTRRRGMGATLQQSNPQAGAIASAAATTATSVVGTLVALGTIGGPVGAAIAGLIGAAYAIANLFGGCGETCVEATNLANQAAAIIDQAYFQYMNSPVHYASMQSAYLTLFKNTMQQMDQACNNPQLGQAGQNCIAERANNGQCTFKTPAGAWQQTPLSSADAANAQALGFPTAQGPNGWVFNPGAGPLCWNSWIGRYNPVANDPTVVADPGGASSLLSSVGGGSILGVPAPIALGGLALLGLAWWASD